MNTLRTIKSLVYAGTLDLGGMPVRQAFPSAKIGQVDPFLLLHHADLKVPSHIPVKQAGVGPHPHRGFSPVTIVYKGGVQHRDSRGNVNVVYEGGTQWMNAGMGIIHSERPPQDIFDKGGRQEIVQLWVNTPAAHKMDQPSYFPLNAEDTPTIISEDGLVKVLVHAGEHAGKRSPVPTLSPVNVISLFIQKGGRYQLEVPVEHSAFFYVLKGKLNYKGDGEIEAHYAAILNNDGSGFELEALEDAVVLLGSGTPLNEAVTSHGPFVMNNQTEIMEAFRDYKLGKMGVLIED
ncbi:pirin family protein [Segetibacter sp. 3557_3]|uniref:pirin family protein n=1 Tax=Segetibacter sp. 3557_3 TaxID=2547429 RepID=UPI001059116C|nr:pirin family protein [Segetibacter sp. 3557_3]TDH23992.1 pirin family protein [Segetibacter sp. 3557_3]